MRAWQIWRQGEPREALRLARVELPEPGPGQLRVRVDAAGVGLPDVYMCRGSYALTPALPFTPGQELVGVVTAAGEGARAGVGERVMAVSAFHHRRGSFAEECLAGDDFAMPVPERMEDVEAAGFIIPYHTAYTAFLGRDTLRAGEEVLVLGAAGGTGAAAVQLARALGARVIATAGGPEKVAFVRSLGADVVIDYREADIAKAVREATGGRGVDVVYDPVGGSAYDAATRCIASCGRVLLIGFASGDWARPQVAHMVARNYSAIGVMPGAFDRSFKDRAHEHMLRLWKEERLRVPIHRVFPFDEVSAAVEEVAAGRMMGKVVVAVGAGRSS